MNSLALELNGVLDGTAAGRLLSDLGRRLYFPKGIIAQSAEAKKAAHTANATLGMAYSRGRPLILSAVADSMPTLTPEEAVAYAPTAGVEKVRRVWKDLILQKNPSLNGDMLSLPAVVPGLTAGISYTADLFLSEGGTIISAEPCWDNYSLIFRERRNANHIEVPVFGSGTALDLAALEKAVKKEAPKGKLVLIFNFPHNPSGYSPTGAEVKEMASIAASAAEGGTDLLVICDDAYFGHFYEDDIHRESLFSAFAGLHERILAVKIDGPIKEEYAWGLRMGFLTFASKGLSAEHYGALERKLMGAIRSSVSCANTPAQHFILKALEDTRSASEKEKFQNLLRRRYSKVKQFVTENPGHPVMEALPFNSGYFMCFRCKGLSAEVLRQELLTRHGIGVIALGSSYLRVAFSSLEEEAIPGVYRTIYDTARELIRG